MKRARTPTQFYRAEPATRCSLRCESCSRGCDTRVCISCSKLRKIDLLFLNRTVVSVRWVEGWFIGRIVAVRQTKRGVCHQILYDDGDICWHHLFDEQYRKHKLHPTVCIMAEASLSEALYPPPPPYPPAPASPPPSYSPAPAPPPPPPSPAAKPPDTTLFESKWRAYIAPTIARELSNYCDLRAIPNQTRRSILADFNPILATKIAPTPVEANSPVVDTKTVKECARQSLPRLERTIPCPTLCLKQEAIQPTLGVSVPPPLQLPPSVVSSAAILEAVDESVARFKRLLLRDPFWVRRVCSDARLRDNFLSSITREGGDAFAAHRALVQCYRTSFEWKTEWRPPDPIRRAPRKIFMRRFW